MTTCSRFLSIDPGLHTGWALWESQMPDTGASDAIIWPKPIDCGTLWPAREKGRICSWYERTTSLWSHAFRCFDSMVGMRLNLAAIEAPAFYDDKVVIAQSGNLLKLALLTGGLCYILEEQLGVPVQMINVRDWKGQLPKAAVETRLRALYKPWWPSGSTSHLVDAIGIGLYIQGHRL